MPHRVPLIRRARPLALTLLGSLLLPAALAAAHSTHAGHAAPTPAASQTPLSLKPMGARVVAVPPGIQDTSAFVTLSNPGSKAVVLSSVSTPAAHHAMLMVTRKDAQGRLGMQTVKTLTVPARGTLSMGPGGNHIMLMGLRQPLKPGQALKLTLGSADGRRLTVTATVLKP